MHNAKSNVEPIYFSTYNFEKWATYL